MPVREPVLRKRRLAPVEDVPNDPPIKLQQPGSPDPSNRIQSSLVEHCPHFVPEGRLGSKRSRSVPSLAEMKVAMKEAVREVLAGGGHGALSAPAQDTQFEPDEGCGYIVLDEVADIPHKMAYP